MIELVRIEDDDDDLLINEGYDCYSLLKEFMKGVWKEKIPNPTHFTTPEQVEQIHF